MGYKNILVTLDSSKLAETALDYLPVIAEAGSNIHLLTVVADTYATESAVVLATTMNPDLAVADLASLPGDGARTTQTLNLYLEYLHGIKERLSVLGYIVSTESIPGDVTETILDVAKRGFDAILIATHGRTGFGRLVLGSVTESVIRRANCPVIIVPVRDPHKPDLLPQPKLGNKSAVKTPELKVLVSLDGTTDAELVLPEVEHMVANRAAKVVLVRVERAPDYDSLIDGLEPGTKRALSLEMTNEEGVILGGVGELASHRYLEEVAERFEKLGVTVVCEVGFNNPVDEILFFSDLYHVDLVAMATHGRTGLARLLHGSVTESVLHRAPCPMLVVRKEELAPATLPTESDVAVSAHARASLKPKTT